jgi:hypothetical protein
MQIEFRAIVQSEYGAPEARSSMEREEFFSFPPTTTPRRKKLKPYLRASAIQSSILGTFAMAG